MCSWTCKAFDKSIDAKAVSVNPPMGPNPLENG